MTRTKKAFAILLSLLLMLSAVACAKKAQPTDTRLDATTATWKKTFYPAGTTGKSATPTTSAKGTTPTTKATSPATAAPTNPADTMRPEFKSAMDEYEKFFDEYCAFMKKYAASGNSLSMLGDYFQMLEQYTQTMESLEQIGDWDLNAAERSYYIETFARISRKLAEVVADADDPVYGDADVYDSDYETDAERQKILAEAAAYRERYKQIILTATDLYEHLCLSGYDEELCAQICFAEGVEGFYDGAAMYDFERIQMFHAQGYRREAIIHFYYSGEYSYDEIAYLVDECLAGRKLTYMMIDDEKVLAEVEEIE